MEYVIGLALMMGIANILRAANLFKTKKANMVLEVAVEKKRRTVYESRTY